MLMTVHNSSNNSLSYISLWAWPAAMV